MYKALIYEKNFKSVDQKPTIELFLGFSYNSCFWKVADSVFHISIAHILICEIDDTSSKLIVSSENYHEPKLSQKYYFEDYRKQSCYAIIVKT